MTELASHLDPKVVEAEVGLVPGSLVPIAWMILQEMAAGREVEHVAAAIRANESEINDLIDSCTGTVGDASRNLWQDAITLIRSVKIANAQKIEAGWDSLEAMTVHALSTKVKAMGPALGVKDALAIASIANKAVRRDRGEGASRPNGAAGNRGGGGDIRMGIELNSGHIGSIRMTLSARVQQQLSTPRVIDQEVNGGTRAMLTMDATRKLLEDE